MSATVKELKECLEQFDDDVEVFILNEGRGFEPAWLEMDVVKDGYRLFIGADGPA
jgi:hypothetical protein